jgi:MFS family permease
MSESFTVVEHESQAERPQNNAFLIHISQYAWTSICVGAIAMAATYPGRTHGLGTVTEPLLKDFGLDSADGRVLYASLGFWATLIGSLFCIPVGWLIDRFGQRPVLFCNMIFLGASVLILSSASNVILLFLGLLMTRGFGQAALSVVSISIVSHSHPPDRLGLAMAFYAILSMPLHLLLIYFVGWSLNTAQLDWRIVWSLVGIALLLGSTTAYWLPLKSATATRPTRSAPVDSGDKYTLRQALGTPAFWLFSLTISIWGMIYAGISLFNQDIFRERNFDASLYFQVLSYMTFVGLASKLFFGWLVNYVRLTHLLGVCMMLSAVSLFGLRFATQTWHAYAYGTLLGIASGAVALLFFASWGKLYGHCELGQIQGVAQMMTVFASAAGPLVFSLSKRHTESYAQIFFVFGASLMVMSLLAFVTPLPKKPSNEV